MKTGRSYEFNRRINLLITIDSRNLDGIDGRMRRGSTEQYRGVDVHERCGEIDEVSALRRGVHRRRRQVSFLQSCVITCRIIIQSCQKVNTPK